MKTKLYLLTTFIFITLAVSAQNYKTLLMENWVNNTWVGESRSTNTYDANGHLIKTTMEEFTDTAGWVNTAIMTNTLNEDGTVKETITQAQDSSGWQDISKTVYTYNASKQLLTASTQMNMEGTWIDFTKMIYTYNDQNQLTNQVTQLINMLSGSLDLINSDQNIYSYNSDGTENQVVSQNWNIFSNEWENYSRYTNTYDNSKRVTSDLSERWNNNAWVNESRTSYTLSAAGMVQQSTEQEYIDNTWVNSLKDDYSYNGQNEMTEIVTQKWNTSLSQWENESRLRYAYDGTGIHPIELTGSLVAFPNPFTDQITIQSELKGLQTIEVYNASGKLIYSVKSSENSFKMDFEGLENGFYLIKTPQNNQSIKVLKTR